MNASRRVFLRLTLAQVGVTLLAACSPAPAPSPTAAPAKPTEAPKPTAPAASPAAPASPVASPAASPAASPVASPAASPAAKPAGDAAPAAKPVAQGPKLRVAMVLPGTIQDADYNAVGYLALQGIEKQLGFETGYSEQVAVADAERVAREFLSNNFDVVAFHGGQFLAIVTKLAPQFQDKVFVIESSGRLPDLPPNVWNIGRKFHEGYYALGALAALTTKTNKIGFVAGVRLPDFVSSINSVKLAISENNPQAELLYAFVGDQNDPVRARQTTESQINSGVDFVIVAVNLGVYGVVEAAKAANRAVLLTTYYTDKKDLAPNLFTTSLLSDFDTPYLQVLQKIQAGEKGGYVEMRPGNGFRLAPITNVPADVAAKVNAIFEDVANGNKRPPEIIDRIQGE